MLSSLCAVEKPEAPGGVKVGKSLSQLAMAKGGLPATQSTLDSAPEHEGSAGSLGAPPFHLDINYQAVGPLPWAAPL